MFRMVSVRKLFLLLLAAVVALMGLFFLHGPFLEEGVDQAVHDILLLQGEPGTGEVRAEGHRLFQCARKGDGLEVAGVYSLAYVDGDELTVSSPAAFRVHLSEYGNGTWVPSDPFFQSAGDEAARKELLPLTLRVLMGDPEKYADELRAQIDSQLRE